ncbi:unnamed protein product [Leuciscus chuanchicus]
MWFSSGVLSGIVIAVGCVVLLLVCIIMFKRKRNCGGVSDVKQSQVQQPSGSDRNHNDDGLYARVSPSRTRTDRPAGKTESTDSEKIKYATIQHNGNNEAKYENLRTLHHDPAARRGAVKDNLVIYSSIK